MGLRGQPRVESHGIGSKYLMDFCMCPVRELSPEYQWICFPQQASGPINQSVIHGKLQRFQIVANIGA